MSGELQVIRDSIFAALQERVDYRPCDATAIRAMINGCVRLGRLDPGQWAPDALVVAQTEQGLPDPYQYDFWNRVTEIANRQRCRVESFDVTHFTVAFYQEMDVPPDVSKLIDRA